MPNKFSPDAFHRQLAACGTPRHVIPDGRRKGILGDLDKLFTGREGRHAFLRWAFGSASSKNLTDADWWALRCWLGAQPDEAGVWRVRKECATDAAGWLYWYQKEVAGQMEMEMEAV